jgi:hypothetical protein
LVSAFERKTIRPLKTIVIVDVSGTGDFPFRFVVLDQRKSFTRIC